MIILNFSEPISQAQLSQIRASVLKHLDARYVTSLPMRVINVPQCNTVAKTLNACGLTTGEWQTQFIVPRISPSHPFAGALLTACNVRRGSEWPIIRSKQ